MVPLVISTISHAVFSGSRERICIARRRLFDCRCQALHRLPKPVAVLTARIGQGARFRVHDAKKVLVHLCPLNPRQGKRADLFPQALCPVHLLQGVLLERPHVVVKNCLVDFRLGSEIEIEGSLGNSRLPGNLIHDSQRKSPPRKDRARGIHYLSTPKLRDYLLLGFHALGLPPSLASGPFRRSTDS